MADREPASSRARSRERQILDAAVTVFADRGFHSARISDIAAEAGVAYGLVYHYFDSKERILETIFKRAWRNLSQGLTSIERSPESQSDKLAAVVRLMLGSYRLAPELVRVLILEVTRSGHLGQRLEEIGAAFAIMEEMIRVGQQAGEFRSDVDPRLVSYILWGAVDEVVTAWVFDMLPSGDADVATAERTIVGLVLGGLLVRDASPAGTGSVS